MMVMDQVLCLTERKYSYQDGDEEQNEKGNRRSRCSRPEVVARDSL